MEKHLPFLVDELHEMWLDTTKTSDDADNSSLMNDIYAWRTAGLPKGSDTIGRPLSVGSVPRQKLASRPRSGLRGPARLTVLLQKGNVRRSCHHYLARA